MATMSNEQLNTHAIKLILSTAQHPLDYAKILIQIGFEPVPPRHTFNLIGKPVLKLPNIFQYVKHIKRVDGFSGCFRGLSAKISGNIVSIIAKDQMHQLLDKNGEHKKLEHYDDDELTNEEARDIYFREISREALCHSVGVIASHPFHVVTIRMMAQFVGRETEYCGLIPSFIAVYKNDGILGFFNGLVPRLIGEISTILIAGLLTFYCNRYLVEDKQWHSFMGLTMSFTATTLTYPFTIVSNCMAVSGSGLKASLPPNMPIYTNWLDCFSHLSKTNQLKRGSNVLSRTYVPPTSAQRNVPGI